MDVNRIDQQTRTRDAHRTDPKTLERSRSRSRKEFPITFLDRFPRATLASLSYPSSSVCLHCRLSIAGKEIKQKGEERDVLISVAVFRPHLERRAHCTKKLREHEGDTRHLQWLCGSAPESARFPCVAASSGVSAWHETSVKEVAVAVLRALCVRLPPHAVDSSFWGCYASPEGS